MTTLRTIARLSPQPLDLRLATHRRDATTTVVRLRVSAAPGASFATLYAHHTDPEGEWTEQVDAGTVMDRVGECAIDAALGELRFLLSGTPTTIYSPEDLAARAPTLLDS